MEAASSAQEELWARAHRRAPRTSSRVTMALASLLSTVSISLPPRTTPSSQLEVNLTLFCAWWPFRSRKSWHSRAPESRKLTTPMRRMPYHAAPPVLPFCASCTEQTDANLSCARCCSPECQKADWSGSGGRKQACKGLTRARLDTDPEAQSRVFARFSHMSGRAPDDAHC